MERLPRTGWHLPCGGDGRAGQLRRGPGPAALACSPLPVACTRSAAPLPLAAGRRPATLPGSGSSRACSLGAPATCIIVACCLGESCVCTLRGTGGVGRTTNATCDAASGPLQHPSMKQPAREGCFSAFLIKSEQLYSCSLCLTAQSSQAAAAGLTGQLWLCSHTGCAAVTHCCHNSTPIQNSTLKLLRMPEVLAVSGEVGRSAHSLLDRGGSGRQRWGGAAPGCRPAHALLLALAG